MEKRAGESSKTKYQKQCVKCGLIFTNATLFARHNKNIKSPLKFKCKDCCCSYKAEINLIKHVAKTHSKGNAVMSSSDESHEGIDERGDSQSRNVTKQDDNGAEAENGKGLAAGMGIDPEPQKKRPRVTFAETAPGVAAHDVEEIDDVEIEEYGPTQIEGDVDIFEYSQGYGMKARDKTQVVRDKRIATTSADSQVEEPPRMVDLVISDPEARNLQQVQISVSKLFEMWRLSISSETADSFNRASDVGLESAVDFLRGGLGSKTPSEIKLLIDTMPDNYVGELGLVLIIAELLTRIDLKEVIEFAILLPNLKVSGIVEDFVGLLITIILQRSFLELLGNLYLIKLVPRQFISKLKFNVDLPNIEQMGNERILELSSLLSEKEFLLGGLLNGRNNDNEGSRLIWGFIASEYMHFFSFPCCPTVFQVMNKAALENKMDTTSVIIINTGCRSVDLHLHDHVARSWGIPIVERSGPKKEVDATYADMKSVHDRLYFPNKTTTVTIGLVNIYLELKALNILKLLIGSQSLEEVLTPQNVHAFLLVALRKSSEKIGGDVIEAIMRKFPNLEIAKYLPRLKDEDVKAFFGLDRFRTEQLRLYDMMVPWAYASCGRAPPLAPSNTVPVEVLEKFASVKCHLDMQKMLPHVDKLLGEGLFETKEIFEAIINRK